MKIRPEKETDYNKINDFVKTAFRTAKVTHGDEHDYVERNRTRGYVPELALLCEDQDRNIIGYIMLVETTLLHESVEKTVLLAGPLAIRQEDRKKGIGHRLIQDTLSRAIDLGYDLVFLAGDPAYYSHFGFKAIGDYGISCTLDIPDELQPGLMLLELREGAAKGYDGAVVTYYT